MREQKYIITQYFSGTASIKCEWVETENASIPGLTKTYNKSTTWTVSCRSNSVSIQPKELVISQGEIAQLSYKHEYNNNPYLSFAKVFFATLNTDVVSVTETGKVTALKGGEAYVHCYSNIYMNSLIVK